GAKSMPWKTATNDDSTFKPASELAKIYFDQCGVGPGKNTIVYCRIGERSSHTWFVLTYLLGLDNVRNYDGSWTEWGNKVGAPIGITPFLFSPAAHGLTAFAAALFGWNRAVQSSAAFGASNSGSL